MGRSLPKRRSKRHLSTPLAQSLFFSQARARQSLDTPRALVWQSAFITRARGLLGGDNACESFIHSVVDPGDSLRLAGALTVEGDLANVVQTARAICPLFQVRGKRCFAASCAPADPARASLAVRVTITEFRNSKIAPTWDGSLQPSRHTIRVALNRVTFNLSVARQSHHAR